MTDTRNFTNPFPGIRPFDTDEYRLFFGREGQAEQLITRLQRARFLGVVGTSGSGKSSLVRAGLLPAIRGGMMAGAGSGWRVCITRPGGDPIGNLAHELAKQDVLPQAGGDLPPGEAEAMIEATLRRGSLGLVDVAQQARLADEKLLVVVDQFEELFRFRGVRATASTDDEAAAFVKLLLEAGRQRDFSIYVVLTMRSDFLGDCAQFQGLPEAINDGQYLIPRMNRDERRMAITGPIGVTRGRIAEPLIDRLLNDVGDNPDQLPILQHALMRTWDNWMANRRNGEPIGLQHYESIGTMTEALSLHADEAWRELPDDRSRAIAEVLFKELTEKGVDNREIRRPTTLSEIAGAAEASEAEVISVIETFRREDRSFLMPPAGKELSSDTAIDISHESLIRNWDRLQKWVEEEAQSASTYRRLAERAVLHREGKEGLLIDPALQITLDWRIQHRPNPAWANRYNPEFETAIAFLDTSREHRDAQIAAERAREQHELERTRELAESKSRAARRLSWLAAGMTVMFLFALATAVYAWDAQKRAVESKDVEKKLRDAAVEQQANIASLLEREKKEHKKAIDAEKKAEDQSKIAEDERNKAFVAQERAEREAARANREAQTARLNLITAQQATTAASSVVRRAIPIVSQGDLLRRGAEAFRREELEEALRYFDGLRTQLEALRKSSSTQDAARNLSIPELRDFAAEIGKLEQFSMQLGWTHSNIGATQLKKNDVPAAIASYEKALEVFKELPESSGERILLETYQGLGQAYHLNGLRNRLDQSKSEEDFVKSKDFLMLALKFQQKQRPAKPAEIAETHSELARLYLDGGKLKEAEDNLTSAVQARRLNKESKDLKSDERAALAATLRELAEFYQGQEGRYSDAIQRFDEMIAVQEDGPVGELIDHGQEVANSYNDLGQIYAVRSSADRRAAARNDAALKDTTKDTANYESKLQALKEALKAAYEIEADITQRKGVEALRVAGLLQRTSLKLRQMRKSQSAEEGANLVTQLTSDLDELGDAYVKLEKPAGAEKIYLEALRYRESNNERWKSFDRLAKFYGATGDVANAEKYKNELKRATKDNADLLLQLGELQTAEPSAAETYYRDALVIYQRQGDWIGENKAFFRLSKLYLDQKKVVERQQTQRFRMDSLGRYFTQLGTKANPLPKDPVNLVNQYLYAINAVAYNNNDRTEAEAAYHRSLEAYDYIVGNIDNKYVLKFYADTIKDYRSLLNKMGRQADAANLEKRENDVRQKLQ